MENAAALNMMLPNHQTPPKEEYEQFYSFAPLDFNCGFYGFNGWDMQHNYYGTPVNVFDGASLPDFTVCDPFYQPQQQTSFTQEAFDYEWDDMKPGFYEVHKQQQLPQENIEKETAVIFDQENLLNEEKSKRSMKNHVKNSSSSSSSKRLSRKEISDCFYLPITQAARELNVGLTLLKKRCRELGIKRWPHRKLTSLQTLIKNVQDLGNDDAVGLRESIKVLQQEKKLMEEIPDMQLEEKTKRLRQACFKANYKKRKVMAMVVSSPVPVTSCNRVTEDLINPVDYYASRSTDDDDEQLKYFIADCISSTSSDCVGLLP